jgi:hypothetical protein
MQEWKTKIEKIILSLSEEYYANDSDIAFLTKYDVCVPGGEMNLSNEFIGDLWSNIFNSFEYFNDEEAEISILSSNTGARVLEKAPKNSLITSFNTDYTCKVITDLVCQDKAEDGNYFSYMRDISQYFAVKNTNSSKKYDIVIVQSGSQFYKGIDYDDELNLLSSCQYYATRGYHFVGNNGLLVVICTKSEVDDVVNRLVQIEGLDITKYVKSDNVVGIIIEKTDKYEDIEMRMGEGDGAYPNIFHEKRKIQK